MIVFATTYSNDGGIYLIAFLGIIFLIGVFIVCPTWAVIADSKKQKEREEKYRQVRQAHQARIDSWQAKRQRFDELRITPEFKLWKEEQYRCQDKKCAWCQKPIQLNSYYTHVDHIKPLYHGGTNDYRNLVLSCSYCNRRKGDWTTGWTGEPFEIARHHTNSKPDWIKPNKYTYGVKPDDANAICDDSTNGSKVMAGQKAQHKKPTPTIIEKATSKDTSILPPETNSVSQAIRPKSHESDSQDNVPKGKAANSYQKRPGITRRLDDKEQQYLSDIQRMLTDIRANRSKRTASSQPIRPQYYFGPSYEGDEFDPDDPEYVSDQYMSYDYDDWADKYGPEW